MIAEATVKCRRHVWLTGCDCQHSLATHILGVCHRCDCQEVRPGPDVCPNCGKVRDPEVAKRNRRNRQRGGSFERRTAKLHGGRRTGPLGGRDDVVTDAMFAIQTKRAQRFSLNEARTYLADLHRTFPTRTPYVVHALPGERYGVVVIDERDWLALHGPAATEEPA